MTTNSTPLSTIDDTLSFGGRPPIFDKPEHMQQAISSYFKDGMRKRKVSIGSGKTRTIVEIPMPTITGLVLYLGFESRQSFYDYEKRPEFSYTIKKARTFIEREYEEILQTTGSPGAIFALKNFGWEDKSEVAHSGTLEGTRSKIKDFLNEPDDHDDASGLGESAEPDASSAEPASSPSPAGPDQVA